MTSWRARLAALRAERADADDADRLAAPSAEATGAIGANDTDPASAGEVRAPGVVAFYMQAVDAALAALAAPDPDFAEERGEVAAALADEARGVFGPSAPPDGHSAAPGGHPRGSRGTGRKCRWGK